MPKRPTHRMKALVLDTTKLAEQDLILTLLQESGAQERAVAKGARKPGSRLAARSELFCESDFLITEGKNLGIVNEAVVVNAHSALRGDYERVSAASAICELARSTCYEDAADPYLLPICSRALSACEQAQGPEQLLLMVSAYTFKLLAHGGWMPALDACVACGDTTISWFSAVAGGVMCESCVRDVAQAIPITKPEVTWIQLMIAATFDELLQEHPDMKLSRHLAAFAHAWAQTQLDTRLRGFEFLLGL